MKTLVFRLSSLGDVILASAVLNSEIFPGGVDWVVAREFAPILRGHPQIRRLWEFDKKTGYSGWASLCNELAEQGYERVFDLHGSLRTRLASFYFLKKFLSSPRKFRRPRIWRRISKGKFRLYGLFLFKRGWPIYLRPRPFVTRFAEFAGGRGDERPDLTHLLQAPFGSDVPAGLPPQTYYCVMPGSRWAGKCWPARKYAEAIQRLGGMPVVLGGPGDVESYELVDLLQRANLPYQSGLARWDLQQVAAVLAGSRGYLGNDTGLAHLAEALGVPAVVVFGPTTPEMGFGPWSGQSSTVGLDLWCRPCGKDGRRCYRPSRKYLCMTGLTSEDVVVRAVAKLAPERK